MSSKIENLKSNSKANHAFSNINQNYNQILQKVKQRINITPHHKRTSSDFPVNSAKNLELQIEYSKFTQLDKSNDLVNSKYFIQFASVYLLI